jgi:hypothetical protein
MAESVSESSEFLKHQTLAKTMLHVLDAIGYNNCNGYKTFFCLLIIYITVTVTVT